MEIWKIAAVAVVVVALAAVRRSRLGPMPEGAPADDNVPSREDRWIAWRYIAWLGGLLIGAAIAKELWARWQ